MEYAKRRVEQELNDILEKTDKLEFFIDTSEFRELSNIQQVLLVVQLDNMLNYSNVLNLRLRHWNDK